MQKKKKCDTPFCRNNVKGQASLCGKCYSAKRRADNPVRAVFENLKFNAKRRGKFFDLTFIQFIFHVNQNPEHMNNRGRTPRSYSIDRDDNELGYTWGNIKKRDDRFQFTKRFALYLFNDGKTWHKS